MTPRSTTVLLVGDYRYSLTFLRSLARAGHRVIVGRHGFLRFAQHSRFTTDVWEHPPIVDAGDGFVHALVEFLERHPEIGLVMPMGDREITTVAAHAAALPSSVRLGTPPPTAVETCRDKVAMCGIADELGIPQARFATVRSIGELGCRATEVGFPCIVKAGDSLHTVFDHKAVICQSAAELRRAFPTWPEGVESVLVQRFATGPRYNIQFIAREGEVLCRVYTKSLRTDRPDYTGYTVESVTVSPMPNVDEYCQELIARLGYSGLGCAQFLIDGRTGEMSFLEINPRLGAAFAIANHCGVDLPRMGAELALSGVVTAPSEIAATGCPPPRRKSGRKTSPLTMKADCTLFRAPRFATSGRTVSS